MNARVYVKSYGGLCLSIAAMLIGLLGLCSGVVTFASERFALFEVATWLSLVGLFVGTVAIVVSLCGSKAHGGLTYAVLGVILSCPVPSLRGIFHVSAVERRRFDEANTLKYNMVRLYKAMQNYATNHDGRLPEADMWFDSLRQVNPALPDDEFRHPRYPGISVAYNAGLAGRRITELRPDAVFFFEGMGGRNLAGGPELLPPPTLRSDIYIMLVKGVRETYSVERQGTWGPGSRGVPVRWEP